MAEKTPAEKLRLKPGMSSAILFAPDDVDLGLPEGVDALRDAEGADFMLLFATAQAQAEDRLRAIAPAITDKTVAWVAYPKGSKAKSLDISRDTLAAFVRTIGLVVNASVSIDERWSALRFRPLKPGE